MYTEVMKKSLELNKKFVSELSNDELENLMCEFDNYVVEEYKNENFAFNISDEIYRKLGLFDAFLKPRKSVSFEQDDIIKKNPKEVLFYL